MSLTRSFYALFSFLVVGLGQILKGQGEKGLKYMLLIYFTVPILIYFSLLVSGTLFVMVFGIGALFTIIFWLYNVVDAYRS